MEKLHARCNERLWARDGKLSKRRSGQSTQKGLCFCRGKKIYYYKIKACVIKITSFQFVKVSARRRRRATGNVAEADYTADVEAPADEDALKNFNGT